jgi:hypothetical protein
MKRPGVATDVAVTSVAAIAPTASVSTAPSSHWALAASCSRDRTIAISATYMHGYMSRYSTSAGDGNGGLARLLSHTARSRSPTLHAASATVINTHASRCSRREIARAAQIPTATNSMAM